MKKTLIALAALASTAAFAQSSVTISGGMTLGVGSTKTGDVSTGTQITRQTGNLQFAGVEDLGGGLKAGFQVQTTLGQAATDSNDTTTVANRTMLGDRAAYMYLTGDFGTAGIGRGNTPTRSLMGLADVSGLAINSGLSASAATSSTSSNDSAARVIQGDTFVNAVAYVTPSFNGFQATVGIVPVTDTSSGANKDVMSYSLQYANGPLNAAVNMTDYNTYKQTGLFANYDFGVAKVGFVSQSIDNTTGANPARGTGLTVAVPMGAGQIGAGWGKRGATSVDGDDVKQTFVGYRYNLSKRTNVQLVWNKIDRQGGTTTNDVKETQLQLAHTF